MSGGARTGAADVHAARKQLRRARATLRLIRAGITRAQFQHANTVLRDAARPLSGVRDGEVLASVFDALLANIAEADGRAPLVSMRERLDAQGTAHRRVVLATRSLARLRSSLSRLDRRVAGWKLASLDWSSVVLGAARSYRRARRAYRAADGTRTTERLHEWRKQVKYLWYQLELLDPSATRLRRMTKRAHALSDKLGDDHDLAVLTTTLARYGSELGALPPMLERRIAKRRASLQKRAFELGEPAFALPPARFARKIAALEQHWHPPVTTRRRPRASTSAADKRRSNVRAARSRTRNTR